MPAIVRMVMDRSMAAAIKSNKVLVIGGPKVGKKWLLRSKHPPPPAPSAAASPPSSVLIIEILNLNELLWVDAPTAATGTGAASTAAAGATAAGAAADSSNRLRYVRWAVDTKYYTAYLDLHVVPADTNPHDLTALNAMFGRDVQACVLLFDSTQRASYDAIRGWSKYLKATNPPILMLIGNEGSTLPIANPALVDSINAEAFEWSVDNGLEYIPVHVSNDNSKVKPHPAHFGPPEKYGSDRVIESLQANMWVQHTRKPMDDNFSASRKKEGSLLGAASAKKKSHDSKTLVDSGSKVSHTTVTATTTVAAATAATGTAAAAAPAKPAAPSSTTASAAAITPATTAIAASPNASSATATATGAAAGRPAVGKPKTAQDEAALEREMQSFESLFEQMNAARTRNSMNPNMTDEERRAAAEQAVLSLVQSMGLEDDELDGLEGEIAAMNASLPPQLRAMAGGARAAASAATAASNGFGDDDDDELVMPPPPPPKK